MTEFKATEFRGSELILNIQFGDVILSLSVGIVIKELLYTARIISSKGSFYIKRAYIASI